MSQPATYPQTVYPPQGNARPYLITQFTSITIKAGKLKSTEQVLIAASKTFDQAAVRTEEGLKAESQTLYEAAIRTETFVKGESNALGDAISKAETVVITN